MARKPRRQTSKRPGQLGSSAPKHKVPPATSRVTQQEVDELFSNKSPLWIQWRLKQGEYISGEELAIVIEANPGQLFPNDVRAYLCRFLRGQVKRKRGPQKTFSHIPMATEFMASFFYQEELRRLQKARKARGRGAKGEIPPHEQAAKFIKKRFNYFTPVSWRRVANILSSRKSNR